VPLQASTHAANQIAPPAQKSSSPPSEPYRDRIDAAFSGDIAYLFNSAMNVKRLTQNTRPAYIGKNRSAQLAADNDEYRTAVSLACSSQSIATIGSHNISHINKLSFGCGALFNALSIRNLDFLIFAFRFLILIPA
jgi:hypothetical protein